MTETSFGSILKAGLHHFGQNKLSYARKMAFADLVSAFPDMDTIWLKHTLEYYNESNSTLIVERIISKIMDEQFGFYPKQNLKRVYYSDVCLNKCLDILVERFPDVCLNHLRSLILSTSYDHVHIISDHLLYMNEKNGYPKRSKITALEPKDRFRSSSYIESCRNQLLIDVNAI